MTMNSEDLEDRNEKDSEKNEEEGSINNINDITGWTLLSLFLAWGCFGFLTGAHLVVMFCTSTNPSEKNAWRWHMGTFWLALAITAIGGGWCRENDRLCPDQVEMSNVCLFSAQTTQYVIIYTLHFIALAYCISHWIGDGIQMISWWRSVREGRSCPLFFFGRCGCNTLNYYFLVLLVNVFVVTNTWTWIMPWDTTTGLNTLALTLIAEIVVVDLMVVALVYGYSHRSKPSRVEHEVLVAHPA